MRVFLNVLRLRLPTEGSLARDLSDIPFSSWSFFLILLAVVRCIVLCEVAKPQKHLRFQFKHLPACSYGSSIEFLC